MKFVVDAQLPRRAARWLQELGYDALHTLDLPEGNATRDTAVNAVALRDGRVVVTKDADFVNTFLLSGQPDRLLLISTGNITNADLEALLVPNLPAIVAALETCHYVEVTRKRLVIHV